MKLVTLSLVLICICMQIVPASGNENIKQAAPIQSHWKSKKIAFLGDSITDKRHVGTKKNYWQFLQESLGIIPYVYGINGHTFKNLPAQAQLLKKEHGNDIDAILIFAGTNDFNGGIKPGDWYKIQDTKVNVANKKTEIRKRRILDMNDATFRGRINIVMAYLKQNFPDTQIILLTPIHRGYAIFSESNVQPDESFPNRSGFYIDDYIDAVKETANVWSVPVIDLNAICGLNPTLESHSKYFANKNTDLLHPNAEGHYRMAKAIAHMLLSYPADFK